MRDRARLQEMLVSSTPPDDPNQGPWQPQEPTSPGQWPPAAPPPGPGQASPPGPGQWPPSGATPPPAAPPPGGPPPSYPPSAYPPGGFGPPGTGYPTAPAGYSGYGGYRPAVNHPQGTTVLVLGILGLVCCGVLGPVAWIMGNSAMREIDANPAAYSNRGSVQAGRILGIIATVLLVLGIVFYVAVFALGAASSTSG